MAQVHYSMYTRKLMRIMSLPPTDLNLFVHVHFQMLLWKAAHYLGPLDISISEYGREIKDWIIYTSIDKANCSCHRNSAAPTTASAQPALCAETDDQFDDCYLMREPGWKLGNSGSWNCSFCNNVGLRVL